MFEKVTESGVLKYRMPNILEAYDILEDSGFSSGVTSPLKLKRNIVKILGPMLDISGIEGAESYDDILNMTDSMAVPLSEIADEIMTKAFGAFKKKSS
jgi:hypothetical protein